MQRPMRRKIKTNTKDTLSTNQKEELFALTSAMMSRSRFANTLGQSFGGDRDLYQSFGLSKE